MSEVKDPAIKLFGKTIQLLHLDDHDHDDHDIVLDKANEHIKKTSEKQHATTQTEDTCPDQSTSSGINNDDPKTPTTEKETSSKNTTKKDNPTEDSNSNTDEKPQKPDKILPCPRCNSMDTKFCYYNNYNVNQPRHFCKNCQRYWTAGGTMRNTPVGSGRRKNKSSSTASYYRHLIVNDASLKTNGGVLNFGSDVPVCESMNKALKFSDKTHKPEHDHSTSASNSNSAEKGENSQKYPLHVPCFPAPQWSYPWNSSQYRPVSFYPPPQYWGYNVQVQPTPWSMQWIPPPNGQISPNSPLGKHSRDGGLLSSSSSSRNDELSRDKDSESGVVTPKSYRPNEAAKSSLWSTLGISNDENGNNSINGGSLYKAFQSKRDEKNEGVARSLVNLQANPAALSRSLNFRETS